MGVCTCYGRGCRATCRIPDGNNFSANVSYAGQQSKPEADATRYRARSSYYK